MFDLPNYENIQRWADWFARRSSKLRYGLAVIVGVCIGLALSRFAPLPGPLDALLHPKPALPSAQPEIVNSAQAEIVNFGNDWPRTDMGTEFNIFSDVKFLGQSSISYETVKGNDPGEFFLRLHYSLNRGSHSKSADAYCGIYFEWTEPPPTFIDASSYSGLSFKASFTPADTKDEPQFILNIGTPGVSDSSYFEYDFTELLSTPGKFYTVDIPFSSLKLPPWATTADRKRRFRASEIFRISITIKGTDQSGSFDFKDMKFTSS